MNKLDRALDELSDAERNIVDSDANEYLERMNDVLFHQLWIDLQLVDASDAQDFFNSEAFTDCTERYQTDIVYWIALQHRKAARQSAKEEAAYIDMLDKTSVSGWT